MRNIDNSRGCLIGGAAGDAQDMQWNSKESRDIRRGSEKMLREEEQRAAKQREAEEHRRADKRIIKSEEKNMFHSSVKVRR